MTTITEANKALVRRYLQAVIDGDVDTVEGVQHPDCKWWVVGQGDIDRETFNAMTRSGLLAAEKRSLEIISMTAEGDRVAYEAKGEMVFPDRVYSNSYHHLRVIRDGLIEIGRASCRESVCQYV